GQDERRAYVLVLDGLRPDEVTPTLMPQLSALRAQGTWYRNARSLPVMETIPNHTMMMSGVRPDRTGVPANSIYDRDAMQVRTLDQPEDLRSPTLLERLPSELDLSTGSVLSKEYLYGIFGERASYRWQPAPIVPVSGHAPDAATTQALIEMVDQHDPALVFANLGDIDRMGHSDLTGTTLKAARAAALADTDLQLGRFITMLHDTGRWESSLLIVLADHSMDWSLPHRLISLKSHFETNPVLAGAVAYAQNGGAELLYWTGDPDRTDAATAEMRRVLGDVEGVAAAHDPRDLRLGPRAGELVVYCEPGWRFSDPDQWSNPIPGNHGHPVTEPIPFLVTGGSPLVRRGATPAATAHTIDVAPTVGAYFGLRPPRGGYDGTVRREALTGAPQRT
ncbi:MAG: alkaline phosphatase family protein, partial [Micromonosporaceae bacterium]